VHFAVAGPTTRAFRLPSTGTTRHGSQPVAFISDEISTHRLSGELDDRCAMLSVSPGT
jgi:hypothetical protein